MENQDQEADEELNHQLSKDEDDWEAPKDEYDWEAPEDEYDWGRPRISPTRHPSKHPTISRPRKDPITSPPAPRVPYLAIGTWMKPIVIKDEPNLRNDVGVELRSTERVELQ